MEQHILIIEDDRTLNAGIAFALEKEGYAVHSALSLLEAEKRLDRKMNLILLDVNLPDGDGISCKICLQDSRFPSSA